VSKKVLLKTCEDKIFSWASDGSLYILNDENRFEKISELDFEYDFFIKGEDIYIIKDRDVYLNGEKMNLGLDFPVRIMIKDNEFLVLDQESAILKIYNSNFKEIEVYGERGIEELEKGEELYFMLPLDFDIMKDKIAIIDTGNRRTVIFNRELDIIKRYPVVGKKVRFYDKNTVLVLFSETIYKIDLNENKIYETRYENIIDFSIHPKTKELIFLKE